MGTYAKNTSVSADRSRVEIENILSRYGATAFAYATNMDKAMLQFQAAGRRIMFTLTLPKLDDPEFKFHSYNGKVQTWKPRAESAAFLLWQQACRQKWRAMALCIKAKLEAVESGIATFEDEFMAHIVMPDGQTVSHHMRPQIQSAYETGKMPPMLPHFGG